MCVYTHIVRVYGVPHVQQVYMSTVGNVGPLRGEEPQT